MKASLSDTNTRKALSALNSQTNRTSDLFGFLAILCAVNWIDRRAEKEEAIAGNGRDLWGNLSVVIKEVCESFNAHYSPEYSTVKVQAENGNRVRIIRQIARTVSPGHTRPEDVSLQIIYEPKHFRITAACPAVKAEISVELEFNPDEYIRPFLSKDGRRLSEDDASEILLKDFLFHQKFLLHG